MEKQLESFCDALSVNGTAALWLERHSYLTGDSVVIVQTRK